jgi:large subunit ribosomal protein L9
MAIRATKGAIKQSEDMRRAREAAEARARDRARELAEALEGYTLAITAKVGREGKLFGSITAAQIVSALEEQRDIRIDHKQIELGEPIKRAGEHEVTVRLHADVSCTLRVAVS